MAVQEIELLTPLRLFMDLLDYSYEELARETGISVRTLKRYAYGEQEVTLKSAERIAPVFGCSVNDLVTHRGPVDYYLWSVLGMETIKDLHKHLLRRREFLGLTGTTLSLLTFSPSFLLDQDEQERLQKVIEHPSSMDTRTLASLELITMSQWDMYRNATVKADYLGSVLGHLKTLKQMLQYEHSFSIELKLLTMVSHTAQIAGEIVFDRQDLPRASDYYSLAIEAAQVAGDQTLEAIAWGRLGFLSIYRRKFQNAFDPLNRSFELASKSATPTAQSWILMMIAEAQSNVSDADGCSRSIEQAKTLLAHAIPGENDAGTGFNSVTCLSYEGVCYLRLHKGEAAGSALEEALQAFDRPTRRRSIILADRALAFTYQKEIEQACTIAGQALDLARLTQSSRALQRLRAVQKELRPWQTKQCVRDLNEQMKPQ